MNQVYCKTKLGVPDKLTPTNKRQSNKESQVFFQIGIFNLQCMPENAVDVSIEEYHNRLQIAVSTEVALELYDLCTINGLKNGVVQD
jgi:hypothetical protein